MICSSLNRFRFISGSLNGPDSSFRWRSLRGSRQLLTDQLGSVVAVSNASGAASSLNTYDEYGQPRPSNAGRFQFTGAPWLAEAGLLHLRARAYDPALGRFLQTDPILTGGGLNLYAYVGNDPVNAIDPSGLGILEDEIKVRVGLCRYEEMLNRRDSAMFAHGLGRLTRPGGTSSGETGDSAENDPSMDEIVVTGQRPDNPPLGLPPPAFILVQAGSSSVTATQTNAARAACEATASAAGTGAGVFLGSRAGWGTGWYMGMAAGAAVGTFFFPPPPAGTIVGGAMGALAGGLLASRAGGAVGGFAGGVGGAVGGEAACGALIS